MTFHMNPVGSVHNARPAPANSDHWGRVVSTITIDARFGEDCLAVLADFSHVEVLFIFDQATSLMITGNGGRPRHEPTCPRWACSQTAVPAAPTASAPPYARSFPPKAADCASAGSTPSPAHRSWTSNQ